MKKAMNVLGISVLLLLFSCSKSEDTAPTTLAKPIRPITVKSLVKAADM